MTPSEAHDSAWQREPGHDAMQLAVMRAIGRDIPTAEAYERHGSGAHECKLDRVHAEGMFIPKGGRSFFADIEARYSGSYVETLNTIKRTVRCEARVLFEIKPRIYSAGAVIRQVRTLQALAEQWANARQNAASDFVCSMHVRAVVKADDPLAQTLADLWQWPVMTWNGDKLQVLLPSFDLDGGLPMVQP